MNDVAKASAKGSLFLFLGQTSSTLIMGVASFIIAGILGPADYGIYLKVLIVPSLLAPISDLAISPALTRFTAQLRSESKERKAACLIKIGITSKLLLSILLSIILLLFSEGIAIKVLKMPHATLLIRVGCLYLFGQAVLQTVNSTYVGLDKTEKCSILMNIQAITKAAVSIMLVLLGFGVMGATLGVGLSFLLASGIGISLILLRTIPTLHRSSHSENVDFSQGLRLMTAYGMPLYFSTLLSRFDLLYRSFVLTLLASNVEMGNYGTAMNFSVLITLLVYPITTSLFPAFSKLSIEKDREPVEKMFRLSIKYSSLVVIPASLALVVFSRQLVYTFRLARFDLAPSYLSLYALVFLYSGLGTLVLRNFLNGQGKTKAVLKIDLVSGALSLPLLPALTLLYGVPGLIVAVLASQLLSAVYGLYLTRGIYGVSMDWNSSLRIGITSLSSALLVYIFLRFSPLSAPVCELAVGGSLYLVTFLIFAPLFRAVDDMDIKNLHELTKGLPIYPIARRILSLEGKISKISVKATKAYIERAE